MFYWLCHNCKPHHAQVVSGDDRSSTNHISRFAADVKAREIENSRQGEKATQANIYMYATEHQCQQPKRKKKGSPYGSMKSLENDMHLTRLCGFRHCPKHPRE